MGETSGHEIKIDRDIEDMQEKAWTQIPLPGSYPWEHEKESCYLYTCSVTGCVAAPEFRCSYRYITGRKGRASRADRHYCREHAQKFADKYGLTVPEVSWLYSPTTKRHSHDRK